MDEMTVDPVLLTYYDVDDGSTRSSCPRPSGDGERRGREQQSKGQKSLRV